MNRHVQTYRQTDRQTDKVIPKYPNFVCGGYYDNRLCDRGSHDLSNETKQYVDVTLQNILCQEDVCMPRHVKVNKALL